MLGAGFLNLPPEVKRFFKMCLDKMVASGMSATGAAEFFARLTGAMVMATALQDVTAYDRATSDLLPDRDMIAA